MRPIVIFENDSDTVDVIKNALGELGITDDNYYVFSGYDEFLTAHINPADIYALFLDHHLDGILMGNDVLAELNEQGFMGKAYSLNNFGKGQDTYYQKIYTRNFPDDRYQILSKSDWNEVYRAMKEAVELSINEANLGDIH